ncbi:hypothetical protein H9Q73_009813 [Fusarium xylarioides]|nr:hypothetical protein H9Q73_009813 [Fusarium xylarioides]
MDAFNAFNERMARGESDPANLAAMARITKFKHNDMEEAKQEAEDAKQKANESKKDYETRRRQFGPNQQLMIQKVDDICPTLQRNWKWSNKLLRTSLVGHSWRPWLKGRQMP